MSCAKSNLLRTLKQIKGWVEIAHYYDGRKVFELGGCKESCLESTILKIISRMAKRGQVLVCVWWCAALSAAAIIPLD